MEQIGEEAEERGAGAGGRRSGGAEERGNEGGIAVGAR